MIPTQRLYQKRFPTSSHATREVLWQTLCMQFFQRYVRATDTLMDIGAGYCEFINAISCKKKIAVDINPDTKHFAASGVTVLSTNANNIPAAYNGRIDVIFLSNFLEHLESKEEVLRLLTRITLLLAPGGKLILLQPNIDLVHEHYWDFFDHTVVFNTSNIREVLNLTGFTIDTFIIRFLPYTTAHSHVPISPLLISLYLFLPPFLRIWAGQSLVIASVPKAHHPTRER